MKELDHPFLLRMVGVCTLSPPLMMMFENHGNGVLKTFLNAQRGTSLINECQQITMARQICSAMSYISQQNVVHKDLVYQSTPLYIQIIYIHTHTHTYIYIYTACMVICVCMPIFVVLLIVLHI